MLRLEEDRAKSLDEILGPQILRLLKILPQKHKKCLRLIFKGPMQGIKATISLSPKATRKDKSIVRLEKFCSTIISQINLLGRVMGETRHTYSCNVCLVSKIAWGGGVCGLSGK